MSLTATDLSEIRAIIREEIQPLEGKIEALESDVKEIYGMLTRCRELLVAAKQAGVTLPR